MLFQGRNYLVTIPAHKGCAAFDSFIPEKGIQRRTDSSAKTPTEFSAQEGEGIPPSLRWKSIGQIGKQGTQTPNIRD